MYEANRKLTVFFASGDARYNFGESECKLIAFHFNPSVSLKSSGNHVEGFFVRIMRALPLNFNQFSFLRVQMLLGVVTNYIIMMSITLSGHLSIL